MDKKYKKTTPRIFVKFIDGETNNVLFEIHDRNWMNVGELFTDQYVDELIKQTIKKESLPENIKVLVFSDYNLK
jgi:hypothetical protein